ncbi:MAG: carboxymuconolactone decarboxylase family protein [Frankia sp.]
MTTFIADFRTAVIGDKATEGGPSGANLLGTLARSPALTKAFLNFNGYILYGTTLPVRQRELLILRVASVRQCEYEWAQHVILAAAAGLQDEEISRIVDGPAAPGWTLIECCLLKAVDELLADARVSSDTWGVLAGELDDQQLMDVVFTVGTYEMVAFALRSFAVEPEADLVPYLPGG